MTKRTHKPTRGPWRLFHKNGAVAVMKGDKAVVHWTGFDASNYPLETQIANAGLIAQAPTQRDALISLTAAVQAHLEALDKVMRGPSTPERGKQVATLCNQLEFAKDRARYFALGIDFRGDHSNR